jgi:signal transduction histidine kinase
LSASTPIRPAPLVPANEPYRSILEEIASELELRPLLTNIVKRACELLSADDGAIGLYDSRRNLVQIEAIHRLPDSEMGSEFEPGEGLMGRVLATGNSVVVERYSDLDRISLPEHANNAVLGVPILGRDGLIGVFGIGARPPRKFAHLDVDTLAQFARHAAIAIQNSLRYEHELQRRERMSLISGVSRLITAGLEPEELVATAAQVIHERLGYANVVIPLLHGGDPDYLLFRSHAGAYRDVFEQPYPLPITSGITGAAVTSRMAQVVNDVREDPRYVPPPLPINIRTELAVPIVLGEEVFGCINIEGLRRFDDDDVSSIRIIADHLAVAIKNTRLSSEARQAAVMRERQRLARDLHDAVSQALSSISLISQSLVSAWQRDPKEGERRAHRLEELSRLAFAEMRALLRELLPDSTEVREQSGSTAGIDDVRRMGLKFALQRFATMLAPQTPTIRIDFSAYQPHAPSLEEGLFLICREALSNAIRHSGAHRVEVLAASVVDESVITIADNGRGFDQRAHALHAHDNADAGIGLNTMRERAAALGATCEISSKPGQGTRVRLRVPFSSTEST